MIPFADELARAVRADRERKARAKRQVLEALDQARPGTKHHHGVLKRSHRGRG